ncbi:MAG: hypothetical protein ACTSRU_20905 [Candidatus Hodarchaeales archaeon]
MEHSEFVQAWKDGRLRIEVDRSKALEIADSKMLPKRYKAANIFWSWVWILSIPAALAVMFLYKWWVGLLILIIVTPAISSSTKKSAMQFIIDHSLENPEFYHFAVSESIITIMPKT